MTAMTLETKGDTQVVVTRRFAAPPPLVYRAHVEPDLIRRWMTGPAPWQVGRCECDPRPGGAMWFGWTDGQGNGFHLTGEYLEIEPGQRILHVERMFLPDPTPDNRVETQFLPDGTGTRLVMTMTLPDAATRRAMLDTGMEHGMGESYDRLDALFPEGAAP
jgi:uncharacterized protein YndB with AHSA1/START domain